MIPVASHVSPAGPVTISRKRGAGTFVYEQGGCSQSAADQYGVSLSSYIHALFSLIHQKRCARVLMIGCGGGTLATLLMRTGADVTVVDVDPGAFDIAFKYFQMPSDVRCVVCDGAAYLEKVSETFDAIVLDAYDGSTIPKHLVTDGFFRSVKARLPEMQGLFLANVYLHHAFDLAADRMVEATFLHWPAVRLLDSRVSTSGNAIVMAGDVADLHSPGLLIYPEVEWSRVAEELRLMAFRESRLGRLHAARRLWERWAAQRFQPGT
ncbi:MAG: fused MFS/spermidine synthase [Rhodospirillaceae bacterium]|nr:fused MFS/spermidine synthase [Rhodospirillaceae bacterium]